MIRATFRLFAASLVLSALVFGSDGYRLPPQEIVDVLDAAPTPDVMISPNAEWMLLVERPAMPTIADVTRPWIGLAGVRVDPKLRAPQLLSYATSITLRTLDGRGSKKLDLPKDARVVDIAWAPTSDRVAFTIAGENGLELWILEAPAATLLRIQGLKSLNAVLGRPFTWLPGGEALLVKTVPTEREGEPKRETAAPAGPSVQESSGKSSPLRTYPDMLRTSDDEVAFAWYGEAQVVEVDAKSGAQRMFGKPMIVAGLEPSPDGMHVLVSRVHGPFSYVLPWGLFPLATEVWSRDGALEKAIVDAPLGDEIPMEGVRTGPRDVQWQPSAPATLWWCEALDGGDPKTKSEKRDRWVKLDAPFNAHAQPMIDLAQRAQGLKWLESATLVMASQYDRDRKWTRTDLYDLTHLGDKPLAVDDRSVNDRYGDPGEFATILTRAGDRVLRQDAEFLYRIGSGASADGERPFLDRFQLTTGRTERLWQCATDAYERTVAIVKSSATTKPVVVTSFETPTEAPNYKLRELETGKSIPLTTFRDPQPAMRGVETKLVKYTRKDGVALSATLYLPKNRPEGERLPLFVWAYPLEFTDASTAGQVSGSQNRFTRVRGASQILFALHGYAVMDNAAMPVVGAPETVNDTFLDQIVMNAQAAIDEADRLGVADRTRCAVGGHSYGAFMTANLLAHCDLFKAGIARSGAYNRTLTPFGFQSERRTIWEAPKSYLELSPFLAANKIHEPLLLIHGEKDDNPGTFPIQSERMFQAIKGNGGTVRLVVLPGEAHGYRARESVLDTVAEMFDWCDRYVRDAKPAEKAQLIEAGSAR